MWRRCEWGCEERERRRRLGEGVRRGRGEAPRATWRDWAPTERMWGCGSGPKPPVAAVAACPIPP
eukprot:5200599-Prymnesium_polylepis.1